MGQCGCGDTYIEHAYELPDGQVVAYDIYHGCDECFGGPGVNIYVYPDRKSEWLETAKIEPFKPDEFGGERGNGIGIGMFEVDDLIAESAELSSRGDVGPNEDQYATISDWLEDFGLELVQGAMRRFRVRIKKEEKKRKREAPNAR